MTRHIKPPEGTVLVEDYVWCRYYGDVHADEADPMREGPADERQLGGPPDPEEGWVDTRDGMWSFVCPGPHDPLLMFDEPLGLADYYTHPNGRHSADSVAVTS